MWALSSTPFWTSNCRTGGLTHGLWFCGPGMWLLLWDDTSPSFKNDFENIIKLFAVVKGHFLFNTLIKRCFCGVQNWTINQINFRSINQNVLVSENPKKWFASIMHEVLISQKLCTSQKFDVEKRKMVNSSLYRNIKIFLMRSSTISNVSKSLQFVSFYKPHG